MSGAAAKAMIEKGTRGRIVTVASRSGLKGDPGLAAYNASKSVALRLTESLAAEVADKGITVNAVLPSVIDTPQNRAGGASEEEAAKWVKPESIADVIAFLLSDAARDISGASIPIYGRA
jgi:NAD(P)-dependent dehydrogenase (short-subunit alcohol dehydrogenase family)